MLEVRQLSVRFGAREVLAAVDLDLPCGEVACLTGASGSGKTTLLRAIAGLQPVHGGTVRWKGADLTEAAAHRRPFGFVFQDGALFPHLDVAANIAFGLRVRGRRGASVSARVKELLDLVGLPGFERASTVTLSGGERQRVALARALAPDPELLLLDEPLSALDAGLKIRLANDLRELLGRLHTTALYVTHDHDEARRVSGRVLALAELQAR